MTTYNTKFSNFENLENWINSLDTIKYVSVLVQIFSGIEDETKLKLISHIISEKLENVTVIGASTAGEILDGTMQEQSIIISLSIFNATYLNSYSISSDDSLFIGKQIAKKTIKDDTKAVIIFADGLKCDGEKILKGFSKIANNSIIVAGGMAGDNNKFVRTFVIHQGKIIDNGAVGVSLNNKNLSVFSSYNLSWRPIGTPMTVTKADDNYISEIDNKPIKEIYKDYLGEEVVENLPDSAIEFPLIFTKNNIKIARSLISVDAENLIFAGDIPEKTIVYFGVASATVFAEDKKKLFEVNSKVPIESIFAYSCTARKTFLGKELEYELKPLNDIAKVSGFFTYGELYSQNNSYQMLNVTTTVIGISEAKEIKKINHSQIIDTKRVSLSTTALIHLVEKTISNLQKESEEKENSISILNQYKKAMESSYIISSTDVSGTIIFANKKFCQLSGYTEDELIGKKHSMVRHPATPNEVFAKMWNTIKNKKIWNGVIKNRAKNGTSYYVNATIFPLLDIYGNITSYVAIRDDITEIYQQRDKAQEILNSQDSIVLLTSKVNNKTEIKQLNQRFFEIFDYKDMNDFLSKHSCICDLFIDKENYLWAYKDGKNWLEILLEEQNINHLVLMKDKNYEDRIFSVKSKKINLERETFIISTFTEVTELEKARVTALSAEKAKSAFLATMSHELRTPLNAVIGFSQILMLKKDMPVEMMKTYIDKINISGKHLLNLVNDILDFSKMDSDNIKIHKEDIKLNPIINEVIILVETSANDKKIRIKKEKFTNTRVIADKQLLKQVLLNLLSNAVKFTPNNKSITISNKYSKHWQIISVCDKGIGLSKKQIETIFKPFVQIKEHQNVAIKGTGLGLAISKKIIELHHGKIEIESEVNIGSCFHIYLPKPKDK